jgi:pimeloyl-ACP methyl ester carboxylesterase
MPKVTSKDGTQIAYDQQGEGPAVILVDGAMTYRSFGQMPNLAKLLAPNFSVTTYDRRGRGESGDTQPYTVEREVEDIAALIQQAGGSASLYGISSGANLAMEAAARLGGQIRKLAMYEPPSKAGEDARQEWIQYRRGLDEDLAAGRPGDAVVRFMKLVGTPAEMVEGMRQSPMWPMFEAVGPTLVYDAAVLGADRSVPTQRAAGVTAQTLVMNGGAGFPFMYDTAVALAKAIPHAQHRVLEGQRHDVDPAVIAPVLIEFFKS